MDILRAPYPPVVKHAAKKILWVAANSWMERRANGDSGREWAQRFNDTGVAFIHIPKTGGTSISEAIYGAQIRHRTWAQTRNLNPLKYRRWLTFAVVRDPIDRFLSAYDYLISGGMHEEDAAFSQKYLVPAAGIENFVGRLRKDEAFRQVVMDYWHFQPQHVYVCEAALYCKVNRLIPFESLSEGPVLVGGLSKPLAVLNKTAGRRTTSSDLTPADVRFVGALYRVDYAVRALASKCKKDVFDASLESRNDG